ncbi:DEAD/DEAH box helicase family protein [Candidatus Falkowbacteria bacterium]|nr:DEAD/DEAH box helicase family protein [Candidatus Falkowbacteria bacterium]
MKELREYQKEAFHAILRRYLTSNEPGKADRALVVMASGLGKTVTAATLANWWLTVYRTPVLFMIHKTDALLQAMQLEFQEALNGDRNKFSMGVLIGAEKRDFDAQILFASFQAMANRLDEFQTNQFGLVIIDEAHHGQAVTYRQTIEHFQPQLLFGMTATPNRMDGKDIREIFGEEVYNYNLARALAERHWLAEVDYRLMHDNISLQELRRLYKQVAEGDRKITRQDIDRLVFLPERMEAIAQVVQEEQRDGDKKALVFCRSIEHVLEVAKYLPDAVEYHSQISAEQQARTLQEFRDGNVRALLVIDKFNEAIDIPDAELLVFLRSTVSETIWRQQLGRGLRKIPGKDKVVVLDFVGNCDRLFMIKQLNDEIELLGKYEESVTIYTNWQIQFDQEWIDILQVLERIEKDFYPTWEEASQAARALGIRTSIQYKNEGKYRENIRLPSEPSDIYKQEWDMHGGWAGFLGTKRNFYATWKQASKAARALGIKTKIEYQRQYKYKDDSQLPCDPDKMYKRSWKIHGGWPGFLRVKRDFYATWKQASKAARALGIKTNVEYRNKRKKNSRLLGEPYKRYRREWDIHGGWAGFLGTKKNFYATWEQASKAARALGIKMKTEYQKAYKQDTRLPSCPAVIYKRDWDIHGGWAGFLGTKRNFYATWEQASKAARALGIKSSIEYKSKGKYKRNLRLPSAPHITYKQGWTIHGGWRGFLGTKRKK